MKKPTLAITKCELAKAPTQNTVQRTAKVQQKSLLKIKPSAIFVLKIVCAKLFNEKTLRSLIYHTQNKKYHH
jgi:hypothetical protein